MARSRKLPVVALVVAIMNLALFIPCLCCSGGGVVAGAAMGDGSGFVADPKMKEDMKKQQEELKSAAPNAKAVGIVANVLFVIGSILMVTAAIGLFMKQKWGWWLTVLGAGLLIVVTLVHVAYMAAVVIPPMSKIQDEQMKKNPGSPQLGSGFFQGANYIGLVVEAAVTAGYPLLAVVLLMTGPVRQFFMGARRRDDDFEDDDDRRRDEDDDRRDDD